MSIINYRHSCSIVVEIQIQLKNASYKSRTSREGLWQNQLPISFYTIIFRHIAFHIIVNNHIWLNVHSQRMTASIK